MQNKLWLFSIGQHEGKSLNMGIGPTVSQFIFWFKHDCLWMLKHCLNQFWKKNVGSPLRFFSCGFSTLKLFTRFLFQLHLCLICWYRLMLNSGSLRVLGRTCFSSSLISFNTLIHVVQKSDQVPLVWKIYEYIIQKRTYPNEVTIQTRVRDALLQWLLIPVWS